MRLLKITLWPSAAILLLAGLCATVLAFFSYKLFAYSMANFAFLRDHGLRAVQEGALWQLVGLIGNGAVALMAYVGFKISETELVLRYRRWCEQND